MKEIGHEFIKKILLSIIVQLTKIKWHLTSNKSFLGKYEAYLDTYAPLTKIF